MLLGVRALDARGMRKLGATYPANKLFCRRAWPKGRPINRFAMSDLHSTHWHIDDDDDDDDKWRAQRASAD